MAIERIMDLEPRLRAALPFLVKPVDGINLAAERGAYAPMFEKIRNALKGEDEAERDMQIARIAIGAAVCAVLVYRGGWWTSPRLVRCRCRFCIALGQHDGMRKEKPRRLTDRLGRVEP